MNRAQGRVLVVDQDQDLCGMIDEILHGLGYAVLSARSAAEAIGLLHETAQSDLPDCILLEWNDDAGGLVTALQASPRFSETRVVALLSEIGGTKAPFERGGFIRKPLDLDTLLTAVSRCCAMPL